MIQRTQPSYKLVHNVHCAPSRQCGAHAPKQAATTFGWVYTTPPSPKKRRCRRGEAAADGPQLALATPIINKHHTHQQQARARTARKKKVSALVRPPLAAHAVSEGDPCVCRLELPCHAAALMERGRKRLGRQPSCLLQLTINCPAGACVCGLHRPCALEGQGPCTRDLALTGFFRAAATPPHPIALVIACRNWQRGAAHCRPSNMQCFH